MAESLVIYVNFTLGNFLVSKLVLHYTGGNGFGVCLKGSFKRELTNNTVDGVTDEFKNSKIPYR